MFVLVRWEPIVHDDYPWIVPFWTRLIGVPLHLWTENNLREIGSRLGHVHQDTIELIEGRMLLDIDSRRPLKFARKAESPEGDEVTIEIKYEMLFKHCSTCGMLTHEKEHCPSLQRQGVFARVQTQENRLPMSSHALGKKDTNATHLNNAAVRFDSGARNYRLDLPREAYKRHDDRIIRRRDEQPGRKRYGGARQEAKPYDRYNGASWREKKPQAQTRHDRVEVREETVVRDRLEWKSPDRPDGSYGHQMRVASPLPRESAKSMQADRVASALQSQAPMLDEQRSVGVPKRIASAIVTPSRGDNSDGNVTKRFKGTPRSLAFETLTQQGPKPATEDEQVIEALNDMDITEQLDGGMMDCEMQNDDLMGLELAEMEEKSGHERADHGAEQISQKPSGRSSKHIKHGYKSSASLGGQTKKFEILLRGSPQKRSSSSLSVRVPNEEAQAISLGNICLLDGSWTSSANFSGCGWAWMDGSGNVQLMGTRNFTRRESALHSEVEALRWAMENMLQHSNCQSFGTDCKELIAMVKEPQAWPSFATELERIETLQICFPDFKIAHVPRARNQTADFLAKTARSFHRELCFIAWFNANETIPPHVQATNNVANQVLSLGNICLLDGSWTAFDRFSGCGWVWMDSREDIQLMGTRNFTRCESALHSEIEALRWAMENMLQHSPCQSFGTDCMELIAMINEPQEWPRFATELEKIETLLICFPDFKITHVPRVRNQLPDFLAKSARNFRRELLFIGCSIPVWLPRPPQA
ncbi:hypothetical protein IGI04_036344 [Brassica rapa subsp. trilocularis]|uniref:RNase H type-1 domain-containing protein n=1 Tax=Brassica rapa subsp. trilocularis TaxID=1813537 RepID=A0ABQ7LE90_BRACM|nr:hypothetical protein IGI04_036344 [Brassica rapa subsp. trilocularis]